MQFEVWYYYLIDSASFSERQWHKNFSSAHSWLKYYFEIRKSLYQSNFILSLISAFSAPNSSSRAFLHSQLVQIFLLTTIMNLNFCISLNKSSSHHQASIQLVRQFVLFDHHIIMLLCNIFGVYCCCFGFLISLNLLKFSSNFNLCS